MINNFQCDKCKSENLELIKRENNQKLDIYYMEIEEYEVLTFKCKDCGNVVIECPWFLKKWRNSMLRVSNVLNRYFKQKKILRYFSLPRGEYIIEYKKDDKIKTSRIKFNELDNINDIENKIKKVSEWI